MQTTTPSERDGVHPALERTLRLLGCALIRATGRVLSLPQPTVWTAQCLLHQFYSTSSLTRHAVSSTVHATLFLAAKLSEHPLSIRALLTAAHFALHAHAAAAPTLAAALETHLPLVPGSTAYADAEHALLRTEMYLLKNLGFAVHVELPHPWVAHFARALELPDHAARRAWALASDAAAIPLELDVPPHAIAAGCVAAAARHAAYALPPTWSDLFDVPPAMVDWVAAQLDALVGAMNNSDAFACDLPLLPDAITRQGWTDLAEPVLMGRLGPAHARQAAAAAHAAAVLAKQRADAADAAPLLPPPPLLPPSISTAVVSSSSPRGTRSYTPPQNNSQFQLALEQARARASALTARSSTSSSSKRPGSDCQNYGGRSDRSDRGRDDRDRRRSRSRSRDRHRYRDDDHDRRRRR
ncbi:cyclin-like protein [Blastocladiella britannica]|nr:cyclin-like protein [Blastocladiella britannica]